MLLPVTKHYSQIDLMNQEIWLFALKVHGKTMVTGGNPPQHYMMLHFMYQQGLCELFYLKKKKYKFEFIDMVY